jgi:hypothetical protein
LISKNSVRELVSTIFKRKFKKAFELLMINFDMEENLKSNFAQIVFDLEYLNFLMSSVRKHSFLEDYS